MGRMLVRIKAGEAGSKRAKIFLNGVERDLVIEADEENRFIIRYAADALGKTIPKGDSLKTERLVGDVRIVWEKDHE